MQYHNITKDDMLNGDGLRVVLWVAGCGHACPGCHNPVTWDENGGLPFDEAAKQELFDELSKDYVAGVTFSGGDPLYPASREQIGALAQEIRADYRSAVPCCHRRSGGRAVYRSAEGHAASLARQRQPTRDRCGADPRNGCGLPARKYREITFLTRRS